MSPRLAQTCWLPEAQDVALTVKQDTGVQFSEELEEDVAIEQGDRTENERSEERL